MSADPVVDSPVLWAAAAASALAGLIHFAVVPEHRAEWWAYAVFFTVVGAFQIIWAVLMLFDDRRSVLRSAVVVNALAVLLWVLTRTTGLPFGPDPGQAEGVGVIDVACVLAELVTVLSAYLDGRHRRAAPAA